VFRSLHTQLSAIFLTFLLLVGGSVMATFWAIHTQADDATVINLAGRQRMLAQKMNWLALSQPDSPDLSLAIQTFDQTLQALRYGDSALDPAGRVVILPPTPDPALRAQLDDVIQTWSTYRLHLESFRTHSLIGLTLVKTEQTLQSETANLMAQLDSVVTGFESRAKTKLFRLQLIQGGFFVAALLLLAWGYGLIRRQILFPLAVLRFATKRLAIGSLDEPVPPCGLNELNDLGQAFEAMRVEIAATRELLEARVTQRTRELTTAFEFSQEIVSQLDLADLIHSVADHARALTQAEIASLCLLNKDRKSLTLAARSNNGSQLVGLRQLVRPGLVEQVVSDGRSIAAEATCFNCDFLKAYPPQQCLATPLQAGEQPLGALCVVRPGQLFDLDEVRAFTLLANSAATAITNARLVETGRRQVEQAASLAERQRLAADLHDHLAQTLSFLNFQVERVLESLTVAEATEAKSELDRLRTVIRKIYGQVRAALVTLRKPELISESSPASARSTLESNLAACLADFQESSGLSTELILTDPTALALSELAQIQILHIVREALANVRRHAQARRAWVHIEQIAGEARFTVEDDGCGFDPANLEDDHHLGLIIMRERAERSGGRLLLTSAPGAGTKVTACFPLSSAECPNAASPPRALADLLNFGGDARQSP